MWNLWNKNVESMEYKFLNTLYVKFVLNKKAFYNTVKEI